MNVHSFHGHGWLGRVIYHRDYKALKPSISLRPRIQNWRIFRTYAMVIWAEFWRICLQPPKAACNCSIFELTTCVYGSNFTAQERTSFRKLQKWVCNRFHRWQNLPPMLKALSYWGSLSKGATRTEFLPNVEMLRKLSCTVEPLISGAHSESHADVAKEECKGWSTWMRNLPEINEINVPWFHNV